MKIAIVHELLIKLGGAERVAAVLTDMYPGAHLFTLLYNEKQCGEAFPRHKVTVAPGLQRMYRLGMPRRFLVGWMDTAIENFDLTEYDLVISSSSAFAHGALTRVGTKHLCYCHSPARYLWDQTFAVQGQQGERGLLAPLKRWLLPGLFHRLRSWDAAAASRPDRILANSTTVQRRIDKYWRQESTVIYPPVRTSAFTPQAEHEDYFLIISALSPYKNIDLAIELFNKLPKHRLVIIGDGVEMPRLKRMAGGNIELLGRRSDKVVTQFLQNCRALVFPGEDDFGIVPVEAMACGKPVIALGRGGATETVKDGETGILFAEPTVESLEQAMIRFFEVDEQFDTKTIAKHAEQFSEEAFRKTIEREVESIMGAD